MKHAITILSFALAPLLAAENGAMTEAERAYLLEQLEQSKKDVLTSIAGLSDAQWAFKPAPSVWSIQECAEHVVLAESYFFGAAQEALKTPAVPRPETSNAAQDQKLVATTKDRSTKRKAPEPLVPSGKFATPEDAARAFAEVRDKSISYVKSTNDDLRTHVAKAPPGDLDAYQFLLLMAAHSARHTEQIHAVQADPDYPKPKATAKAESQEQ
jgi:uncharacterized damage-inducible protein DinB